MSKKLDEAMEFLIHLDIAGKQQITYGRECYIIDNVINKLEQKDLKYNNLVNKLKSFRQLLQYDIDNYNNSKITENKLNSYEQAKLYLAELDDIFKYIEGEI